MLGFAHDLIIQDNDMESVKRSTESLIKNSKILDLKIKKKKQKWHWKCWKIKQGPLKFTIPSFKKEDFYKYVEVNLNQIED